MSLMIFETSNQEEEEEASGRYQTLFHGFLPCRPLLPAVTIAVRQIVLDEGFD